MSADLVTDDAPVDEPVDPTVDDGSGADGSGDDRSAHRRSIGPLIALGLAAVLVIASVVVAIVGGNDVSATAVRVDSTEVSQKSFNEVLRDLSPTLRDQGAPATDFTDSFVPAGTAAQVAQVYVLAALLEGHVDVSDAERQQLFDENREELSQYAPALRDRLLDVTVMQNALLADRGEDGAAQFLRRLIRNADVHVDPRYGFWNPALAQVCPPTGCTDAASTAGG